MMPGSSGANFSMRMPEDLKEACQEQAQKERRTLAKWICIKLEEALPDSTKHPHRRKAKSVVS